MLKFKRLFSELPLKCATNNNSLALKTIRDWIELNGSMSMAHYMRLCLTHPKFGYYTTGNRDNSIIGHKGIGDFITSPEVSSVFGDMLAVWMVSQLNRGSLIGKRFRLSELGPGKATLMCDILSCWKRDFPGVFERLSGVDLVEQSPIMRRYQKESLCKIGVGDVKWYDDVGSIPATDRNSEASVILAHEFFDALPVHQFQLTSHGLREIMIDIAQSGPAEQPQLRLGLSRDVTPATQAFQHYFGEELKTHKSEAILEWSPESGHVMQAIAKAIISNDGLSLIADYGRFGVAGRSTFRAIQNHKFVDPLSDPGNCDLTADVDFSYLSRVASNNEGVHVSNMISQREFLLKMGIQMRMKQLLTACDNLAGKEKLLQSYSRLVSGSQMGESYKFMAFTKQNDVYPFT